MTPFKAVSPEKTSNTLLLLPLLPVIFFFAHNLDQFTDLILNRNVAFLFLLYLLASLLVFLLFRKICRLPLRLAACAGTLLMSAFLFFGAIQDFLYRFNSLHRLSNSLVLLFLLLVVVLVFIFVAWRKKYPLKQFSRYLTILFILLIAYESVSVVLQYAKRKNAYKIAGSMVSPVELPAVSGTTPLPDIYYIIFDSYTGQPALKDYWNYENEIYPYLRSKGFFTVDSGFSNYNSTPYSISSMLNMQYLKGAGPYLHSNSSNFLIGRKTYIDNAFYRFLKKNGYRFSIFSQLEDKELLTTFGFLGVEKPVRWVRKQTMERIYLNPWILEKITRLFRGAGAQSAIIKKSMEQFRRYNQQAIDHLLSSCNNKSVSDTSGPLFSFTHIMLPHDPYQVDENWNYIATATPGGGDMNGYLRQIKYSNKLIRQFTDCLLADTTRKKIIIIQGDHGYRHNGSAPVSRQFDALNVIYFYNQDYTGISKKMSHVNTFRAVINNCFNGRLPLLNDTFMVQTKKEVDDNQQQY